MASERIRDVLHMPSPEDDPSPLDLHGASGTGVADVLAHRPRHRLLRLPAPRVEMLSEVTRPMQQRDGHEGDTDVGGGTDRVPRENAEPACVRRHIGVERDLHREVRDAIGKPARLGGHDAPFKASAGRHAKSLRRVVLNATRVVALLDHLRGRTRGLVLVDVAKVGDGQCHRLPAALGGRFRVLPIGDLAALLIRSWISHSPP